MNASKVTSIHGGIIIRVDCTKILETKIKDRETSGQASMINSSLMFR